MFKVNNCSECGEVLTEEEKDFLEDLCFACKRKIDQDLAGEWRHPDNLESWTVWKYNLE